MIQLNNKYTFIKLYFFIYMENIIIKYGKLYI